MEYTLGVHYSCRSQEFNDKQKQSRCLYGGERRPKIVTEINRKLLLLQVQEGKMQDSGTVPIKEIWVTGVWEEGEGTGMEVLKTGQ